MKARPPAIRFAVLLLALISAASAPLPGVPSGQALRPSGLTDQQWREDLDFLAKTVAEKHRHPFDRLARADLDKAVAALREAIPGLDDHEIVVGMAKIVALLRDGHSRLTLPAGPAADTQSHTPTAAPKKGVFFNALAVRFYLFSDGLHVQTAAPDRRDLVGARVVRIGKMTAEEALEAIRPAVHYDSEMWFKLVGPQYLRIPEILHACGVTADLGPTPVAFEKDGRTTTVVLEPLPPGPEPAWVAWSDVSGTAKPLFLKNPGKPYWYEVLPESKAIYVQVNGIQNDPAESLAAFSARMIDAAKSADVRKLVLDLRLNGGGNNYLNRGLVLALIGAEDLNRYGRLFTIIGRNTFSAAMSLVSALERWTETIFVGEPTGNTPSQYGDAKRFVLPHSGLTVRLSSVYWRDSDVDERRPWVAPDIAAGTSWADFAAGRDPVLAAALAYEAPDSLLEQLKEKFRWGGMEAASSHYFNHRNSPATARINTEPTLLAAADFMMAEKRPAEALRLLQGAVAEYPESAACHLALGKRLVEQGSGQEALAPLKKALTLKPGDAEAAAWLKRAEELIRTKK
jgi:tetratricopeptide (TPR) repeat protein